MDDTISSLSCYIYVETMAGRSRSRVGSPSARSLPMLRDDYRGFSPDDFGRSPRYDIEDRLIYQERTTQQLMDKAYKIKGDLLENLNYTHGTWQEEKANRSLLQEHIKSITEIVRKLSRDVSVSSFKFTHVQFLSLDLDTQYTGKYDAFHIQLKCSPLSM